MSDDALFAAESAGVTTTMPRASPPSHSSWACSSAYDGGLVARRRPGSRVGGRAHHAGRPTGRDHRRRGGRGPGPSRDARPLARHQETRTGDLRIRSRAIYPSQTHGRSRQTRPPPFRTPPAPSFVTQLMSSKRADSRGDCARDADRLEISFRRSNTATSAFSGSRVDRVCPQGDQNRNRPARRGGRSHLVPTRLAKPVSDRSAFRAVA